MQWLRDSQPNGTYYLWLETAGSHFVTKFHFMTDSPESPDQSLVLAVSLLCFPSPWFSIFFQNYDFSLQTVIICQCCRPTILSVKFIPCSGTLVIQLLSADYLNCIFEFRLVQGFMHHFVTNYVTSYVMMYL